MPLAQRIVAGDTLEFATSVPDYPATAWTLTHVLRGRAASAALDALTLTAAANGTDYLTTVTAATTAGWAAGDYTIVAQVTAGLARHTLDAVALSNGTLRSNIITILANPSDGDAFDDRSHAQRTLDALEAMIEGRASKAQERYTIRDREVWMLAPSELIKWRSYYRSIVAKEQSPGGLRKYVRLLRV